MTFQRVAAVVFAAVALGHVYRAFAGLPVQIGSLAVPVRISSAGALGAGALGVWGFRARD